MKREFNSRGPGGGNQSDRPFRRNDGNRRSPSFRRGIKATKVKLPADVKVDFKNLSLLKKYLTDSGKIVSHRISGVVAKDQRAIVRAIKQARYLALLPVGSKKV